MTELTGQESSYYLADWLIVTELTGQESSYYLADWLKVAEKAGQESAQFQDVRNPKKQQDV